MMHTPAYLVENTIKEKERMVKAGMKIISHFELVQELDRLGYAINKENSFDYNNRGNEYSYLAKSLYIVEKGSSRSFANTESRRDANFKALQEIRRSTFVFHKNRIWEL